MDGDRAARLRTVVLAVIAGLLGMHALVVADLEHRMPSAPPAVVASPGATTPMNGHPMAAPTMPSVPPAADAPVAAAAAVAPVLPHGGHPSAHRMLHLCLAILAALLLVLPGLAPIRIAGSPDDSHDASPTRGRRDPPRRPPPTSVRLARLCVMRN